MNDERASTSHPFLAGTDLLAHRGASAEHPPGNSVAAFARALELGCDHVETDVQLSSDGEVVVFHDERLDDTTTGRGRVGDHTWAELRELRYQADGRPTDDGRVRLAEALERFPDAAFNVDVKRDEAIAPTVALLRGADARGRVCVAAFGWRRLRRLRRALGPGWCSACSQPEIALTRVFAWLRLPTPRWADVVQLPERRGRLRLVDERFVATCHRVGMQVHVWTVNDLATARRLAGLGVDAVITDNPATLHGWNRLPDRVRLVAPRVPGRGCNNARRELAGGDVTAESTAAPSSSAAQPAGGGVGALLRSPAFAGVLVANVLGAIGLGTSRFVFVWLVGELTEWNPATAILGIVIGLPPLFLSAWAGSLADRIEPRRLGVTLFAIATVLFGGTGLLVVGDLMSVPLAMACGFLTAAAPSMLIPLLQALVPQIVPQHQLMQAVALQNLGMMTSIIAGVFLGGAIIQAFGVAAGFWLLTVASALGVVVYGRTPLPDRVATTQRRGAIRQAAGVALRTEPMRSLLALTGVLGLVIAASTLLLPEIARDVLGTGSLAASALNVCMSLGMVTTSMVLATRWTPARPGLVLAIATSSALGTGLVAIGASRSYALTALVCVMWGLTGGIAMTLMRTLLQLHTPPELMGRVMGLSAMAQNGAFPIGALALFGLVTATSVTTAMIIAGVVCSVLVWAIVLRPTIRSL